MAICNSATDPWNMAQSDILSGGQHTDIVAPRIGKRQKRDEVMGVKHYTKRIHLCSVSKRMKDAERIFAEMKDSDVIPNAITFTAMMRGYYLSGDNSKVFSWYQKMRKANVLPTLMTLGTLLTSCVADGDVRKASEILEEFRSLGMEPNVVGMNALMRVCVEARELQVAIKVFDQIEKLNMRKTLISYNSMIAAYAELGSLDDRDEILTRGFAVKDALVADGFECDLRTFNSLIKLCLRMHDMDRAMVLFSDLKERGLKPDVITYSTLIDGYAKNGERFSKTELFVKSSDLLLEMEKEGVQPNIYTYNSLMKLCVEMGNHSKTMRMFEVMKNRGVDPDVVTYGTMIDSYVKHSGESNRRRYIRRCFGFLDDMRRHGVHPNRKIIATILTACARVRDLKSANLLVMRMKRYDIFPDRTVYVTRIRVHLSVGDVQGAKDCMRKMEQDGFELDATVFNVYLSWCLEQGRREEVDRVLKAMKSREITPDKLVLEPLRSQGRSFA